MASNWRQDFTAANVKTVITSASDASITLPSSILDQYQNKTEVFWRMCVVGSPVYVNFNAVATSANGQLPANFTDNDPKAYVAGVYHFLGTGAGTVTFIPSYPF